MKHVRFVLRFKLKLWNFWCVSQHTGSSLQVTFVYSPYLNCQGPVNSVEDYVQSKPPWQAPYLVLSDYFTVEFTTELFFWKCLCVPYSSFRFCRAPHGHFRYKRLLGPFSYTHRLITYVHSVIGTLFRGCNSLFSENFYMNCFIFIPCKMSTVWAELILLRKRKCLGRTVFIPGHQSTASKILEQQT